MTRLVILTVFFGASILLARAEGTDQPDEGPVKEVCYPVVGCFNNKPPFDNANDVLDNIKTHVLPEHPNKVNTTFQLHTREQRDIPQLLDYTEPSTILQSHFWGNRPTKVVIHGLGSYAGVAWVIKIWNALLDQGDYNVIVINWSDGAPFTDYTQSVANVRLVATQLKLLVHLLQRIHGLDLNDVHFIGHSLGAQVAGYAGALLGSKIARITGLDPADPDFQYLPRAVRLDPTDAQYVDVIHSNGRKFAITIGLGVEQRTGHVDFMLNGGMQQPGCVDGVGSLVANFGQILSGKGPITDRVGRAAGCSHGRSTLVFSESINSSCRFKTFPCESYEKFERGECTTCGEHGCGEMGFYAINYPRTTGRQFINTFDDSKQPFCGSSFYHLRLSPTSSQEKTQGDIYVRLLSKDRQSHTRWFDIFGKKDAEIDNKRINKMLSLDKSVEEQDGAVVVEVKYKRMSGWFGLSLAAQDFNIANIEITDVHTGKKYASKPGSTSIINQKPSTFVLQLATD